MKKRMSAEGTIESDYWKFVNDRVENLQSVTEINHQRSREVLIMLTSALVSTRYMTRAVSLVCRDQHDVRTTALQHPP
jgi:hypothetical protein